VSFNLDMPVHRLKRKAARQRDAETDRLKNHYISSIRRVGNRDTQCIEVDAPSHLFLAGKSMIPTRNSILRNSVVDYYYLKRISNIEAVGIERDMTGLLTMEVPLEVLSTDATSEAQTLRGQLEKMLSELKRDEREFALIPPEMDEEGKPTGYKLKLLTSGGSRQIDTNSTKLYYKISILQSVLAQFIQLGMSGVGSFALASSQTNLFATAIGSYVQIISSTFNRYAVGRLMELNGVPREYWPSMVYGDIETPNLQELGQYLQVLATTGKLPEDEALDRRLLEIAGLPVPEASEGEVRKSPGRGPLRTPAAIIDKAR